MLITVQRRPSKGGATVSEVFLDGSHECYGLEDEVRADPNASTPENEAKVAGKTAIPAGKYRVVMTRSPRFNKVLPLLLDVPGFTGVRIHAGNRAENTDGCLLVGEEAQETTISRSKEALFELMAAIDSAIETGEQVFIEIKNAEA